MKKLMALVLSFGLVLLGAAPVMAAGQSTAADAGKDVAVTLPQAMEIDDEYLNDNVGGNPAVAVLAVYATRVAVRWLARQAIKRAVGAATGAGWEAGNQLVKGKFDGKKLACAAAGGAVATGGVPSAVLGGAAAAKCER
ncbi:MAG: hypothetical protein GXO56_01700 [Chloroflexi bacterium]|nr:hypothetical protein [Chloroflexota bacterium]